VNSRTNSVDQLWESDSAAFLASIIESSDDAIFGMTLDGIVSSWNKAAEQMYGYLADEIVGKSVSLLSPVDRSGEIEQYLMKTRSGDRVPPFETVRVTKDRHLIHVLVHICPVRNVSGAIARIAVIARDISERKLASAAVQMANLVKNQFLDNMSHEIRTPMNGILGMTELVLDSELTPDQRENLGLVKLSTESLLAAVDDILDFSEIDAKKLKLESIRFDFRESLGETMKMLGFRAQKKGLELVYQVSPEIPMMLCGDPGRVRRILYNLIGNAIKFTEAGEILVTVDLRSHVADDICLHFAVRDTGIGISFEQQQTIFEPFSQADGSSSRKYGGTGLGLTIAGKIVDLMHGKLSLKESQPGKGSTFEFTVQLKVEEKPPPISSSHSIDELRGLHVLIVDDNSLNRRVLRGMLNHWGMRATDVEDGAGALQALRVAADIGHPFPLVLLDGQMHGMNGFAVAEQIKKEPRMAAGTIMMLTSVGHVGDAARCRDLGISAYLVKPIRHSELVNAICMTLERTRDGLELPLVTRHVLREAKVEPFSTL
jgi:PAS domain S-box-containing protein